MSRFDRLNRAGALGLAAMLISGCAQVRHLSGDPDVRTKAVADFNSCAKPEYPQEARRYDLAGTVTLMFLINADGRVADSKIMKSSGHRSLDQAAVVGISKCQFKPATLNGVPEMSWMQMQYVWSLK
jgi:protein TonB